MNLITSEICFLAFVQILKLKTCYGNVCSFISGLKIITAATGYD